MWAVIGGSGFEAFDGIEKLEELPRETPFGLASSGFRKIAVRGKPALFLSRHGAYHELLPSEINYRANLFALKQAGATKLISFASVGSLRPEIEPTDLVLPSQYINHSRRKEGTSFTGEGVVGHVSLAQPTWREGSRFVATLQKALSLPIHTKKTYLCVEGPTFSTQAESKLFQSFGADIIGMTGFPEYALAREAGICYLPCCFVTDFDSWNESEEHVTLEQVIPRLAKNKASALRILENLLASDLQADQEILKGNLKSNLFCDWSRLTEKQRGWLEVLDGQNDRRSDPQLNEQPTLHHS